jgi:hypothetical protein
MHSSLDEHLYEINYTVAAVEGEKTLIDTYLN